MRDALLAVIVIVVALLGVGMPRIGLYGYVWFSLLRPDILAFSPPDRPYSKILAASVLIGSLRFLPGYLSLFNNPFLVLYTLLQLTYLVSVFAASNKELAMADYQPFLQMSLVLGTIPLLIQKMKDVRLLMLTFTLSLGVLGVRYGLGAFLAGGARFAQGYGGALSDNNILAMAMACSVPFLWYSQEFFTKRVVRLALAGAAGITAVGSIMFNSRGAFLTLAAVLALLIWRSKSRMYALVLVALFMVPGTLLVWDTVSSRVDQLVNYEDEGSAQGRLTYWNAAIRMSLDYPFTGTGFGGRNSVTELDKYLAEGVNEQGHFIHNTYLQVLADSGYPALLCYCALLFGSIWWLGRFSKRPESADEGKRTVAVALQVSLVGLAVGTTFLSRVLFDYIYIMLLTTATLYSASKTSAVRVASAPVPSQPNPGPLPQIRQEVTTPAMQGSVDWRASARERRALLRRTERRH